MSSETVPPVKAVGTAIDVVEALQELDGAGASELSRHLDIPVSTVHDHLKTLRQREYLIKDGENYHLSTQFLDLGGYARSRRKVFQIAEPEVRGLAQETEEHANLMIEEHGRGTFLYLAKGEQAVNLDTYSGMRIPLHTAALGKAIMAYLPEERVDEILDRHGLRPITKNTITERDQLLEELAEIRTRSYAIDNEERVQGMRCLAAPIVPGDRVLGAVSVSGPTSRMQGERFEEELPTLIMKTANVIEVNITYS